MYVGRGKLSQEGGHIGTCPIWGCQPRLAQTNPLLSTKGALFIPFVDIDFNSNFLLQFPQY
eukprot:2530021-Ditylum_brightwellii.AAC.1